MKNRKFDFRTAYIDLLINLLTGIVVLFMLVTLLIAPITKNTEGIKKNADYVITVEWPETIDCDVDIWIKDPQNNVVSFRTPEAGLMYLERDDMGRRKSVYEVDGKEVIIDPDNKEFLTLRGTFPGEYVLNLHVYSCVDPSGSGQPLIAGTKFDIPVTVEIIKINPSYYTVKHIEMKMDSVWQEKTVVRFVMDNMKNIIQFKNEYVSVRSGEKTQ